MWIYKFVFYNAYLLNKHRNGNSGNPLIDCLGVIILGSIFNVFTLFFLLRTFVDITDDWLSDKLYQYLIGALFVAVIILYFSYRKRYAAIIESYNLKYGLLPVWFNVVVMLTYLVLSFGALMLSAMFMNGDL